MYRDKIKGHGIRMSEQLGSDLYLNKIKKDPTIKELNDIS